MKYCFMLIVVLVGCDAAVQTPEQRYETALHIFTMEHARLEIMDADVQKWPDDERFKKKSSEQSERLQRAKKALDAAEAALK